MSKIDFEQALKFLEVINDTQEVFTFQTFIDQKASKNTGFPKVYKDTLEKLEPELRALNGVNYGIYICPQTLRMDTSTRKAEDVTHINCFFIDKDNGEVDNYPLDPTMIVRSKRGVHAYWVLREPIEMDRELFEGVQTSLARHFNSDLTVKDPSRVLRLPGFMHCKDPNDPYLVHIDKISGEYYTLDELLDFFPFAKKGRPEKTVSESILEKNPRKGQLLRDVEDFLKKPWSETSGNNAIVYHSICNMKKNAYTEQECLKLLGEKGEKVEPNVLVQVKAVYKDPKIEVAPYYKPVDSESIVDLVWSSKVYKDFYGTDTYVIDEVTKDVHKVPAENCREILSKKIYSKKLEHIIVTFDPFADDIFGKDRRGKKTLNIYTPPFWKYREDLKTPVKEMPGPYKALFNHLFGDYPESYNYVLDWMAHSLRGKNIPILCFVGTNRGIGKDVTARILQAIHGSHNFHKGGQSLLSKEFNLEVIGKTFIQLDEVSITNDSELESIKAYTNTVINAEGKGVEAKTRDFHGNILLTNNKLDCLSGVSAADDRQFSVPDITQNKLDVVKFKQFGSNIPDIKYLWTNDDLVAQLANFLWHRDLSKYDYVTNFKSEHYKLVIKRSQLEWGAYLIEDIRAKHFNCMVPFSRVQEELKRQYRITVGRSKFDAFCKENEDKVRIKQMSDGVRYVFFPKKDETEFEFAVRVQNSSLTSTSGFELLRFLKPLFE